MYVMYGIGTAYMHICVNRVYQYMPWLKLQQFSKDKQAWVLRVRVRVRVRVADCNDVLRGSIKIGKWNKTDDNQIYISEISLLLLTFLLFLPLTSYLFPFFFPSCCFPFPFYSSCSPFFHLSHLPFTLTQYILYTFVPLYQTSLQQLLTVKLLFSII